MSYCILDGIRFKVEINNRDNNKPIHLLVSWAVQIDRFYPELERPIDQIFYPSPTFLKNISLNFEHEVITDLDT